MSTATSCPPDRFFSSNSAENDPDDRITCPVRTLPPLTDGPDGVGRALGGLDALGVGPDSFHFENFDRLRALQPFCSDRQIDRFDALQETIGDRIAAMAPAEIAGTLEGLYRSAYVYRDSDRTMALGESPAHAEAKRRLDLWVAAADQRAFSDRKFLDRVWGEPRIRTVMALNSPNLMPLDRGMLELMFRAEPGGDEALERLFRERPLETYTRSFDWLATYDGLRENIFEDPYFRSMAEINAVYESHFGVARVLRLGQSVFPRETVTRLMDERGYGGDYRAQLSLSDDALIQRYLESILAMTPQTRPATRRRLVADLLVMGVVFDERGLDPTRELQRRGVEAMVRNGMPREDAELMTRLQTGSVPFTHDRLDDYRARHALLEEYRSLYTDMLSQPVDESFSPENVRRYGTWGGIVLNRSVMKIPIFLDDLDEIRRDVQRDLFPKMRFGSDEAPFEFHDPTTAAWFTPSDLGICGSFRGGLLTSSALVAFDGRSAEDLICSNVELIAALPPSLHQDHSLATAIGVFGVITLRSLNSVTEHETSVDRPWNPATLLDVATHEAAHVRWFRQNFDRDPQRLLMVALNERQAYASGGGYADAYLQSGFSHPEEWNDVDEQHVFEAQVVEAANETLGIPTNESSPDYWEFRWDAEPVTRFLFQPPDVVHARRVRRLLDENFEHPSDERLDRAWTSIFQLAVSSLPPADRAAAREALSRITDPANGTEGGVFFLESHPFTRAVNVVRGYLGGAPYTFIDVAADDWKSAERALALGVMDRRALDTLRERRLRETRPNSRPHPR